MDSKITGDIAAGAKYAEGCRTAKADSMHIAPPAGPKPERTLINDVKPPKERNISSGNRKGY